MKWASVVNLLIGVWLMCSPWALGLTGVLAANAIVFGIVAFIVACWSLAAEPENHAPAMLNFAIGIWMVISPFVIGYSGDVMLWNNLIAGALMIVFALVRTASPTYLRSRPA